MSRQEVLFVPAVIAFRGGQAAQALIQIEQPIRSERFPFWRISIIQLSFFIFRLKNIANRDFAVRDLHLVQVFFSLGILLE